MKKALAILLAGTAALTALSANGSDDVSSDRQSYKIYVDDNGVMRRSDNHEEVSYYGTNYTAPFAYSYRALGYLGKDRKRAIDRDVYHIARMGLNAFRLHLWDVELADSLGNIVDSDHLDLLDYLIAQFEKRGIDIILTAQTNFGNGYPEANIDTGSYSYDFDKCMIHDDPRAQEIQERYLGQLVRHVNPYTGRSYADDNAIIAIEINNEPCHSGTKPEVTAYINRMADALRNAGFDKPVLYNVTHNPDVTSAYYDADIDGTTYQWYPTGLVSGHTRKGNLLPAFDDYTIAWKDTMPNFDKLARVVYEFDPADVMYSHLYPAVARAFRKAGFQWITQFAYDPLEIAQYNTEYPTHFLNLVYTPAKALSMMIATEVAREIPRGADFGAYPENTTFGNTRISFEEDLSVYNSPEKFIYTNDTDTRPVDIASLRQIAGHGSSPVVKYEGSGAYFLDAIGDTGAWRLELLPDVTIVDDPFGNTDLRDTKVVATSANNSMEITLPQLGDRFVIKNIANGNGTFTDGALTQSALNGKFDASPGVYILAPDSDTLAAAGHVEKVAGNIGLAEYVAPDNDPAPFTLFMPMQSDTDLNVCMIPESWTFRLSKKDTRWDEVPVYMLVSNPEIDGDIVIRRYVSDKINRIPQGVSPTTINVRFQSKSGDIEASPLPQGTQLAIVTSEGFTYSVPVVLDANGEFSADIKDLQPRKGYILPAPYPVGLTRESPASTKPVNGFRDIQFVELIIPQTAGNPVTLLPERIWIK